MNKEEMMIRDLESWASQIADLYEGATDMEGADDLMAVVRCFTGEIRRRGLGAIGTLADLVRLKTGIRLAGFLLQAIQDDEPDAIAGWRYQAKPQNIVQDTYSVIFQIVQELTVSVVSLEREYPEHAQTFADERAAYRISLQQLQTGFQD